MSHFVLGASCVFSSLFIIWQRQSLLNFCVKIALLGMSIWGWYLIFRGGLL